MAQGPIYIGHLGKLNSLYLLAFSSLIMANGANQPRGFLRRLS